MARIRKVYMARYACCDTESSNEKAWWGKCVEKYRLVSNNVKKRRLRGVRVGAKYEKTCHIGL